jgi:hypothetical protein
MNSETKKSTNDIYISMPVMATFSALQMGISFVSKTVNAEL